MLLLLHKRLLLMEALLELLMVIHHCLSQPRRGIMHLLKVARYGSSLLLVNLRGRIWRLTELLALMDLVMSGLLMAWDGLPIAKLGGLGEYRRGWWYLLHRDHRGIGKSWLLILEVRISEEWRLYISRTSPNHCHLMLLRKGFDINRSKDLVRSLFLLLLNVLLTKALILVELDIW
jgi:hypothetical protein